VDVAEDAQTIGGFLNPQSERAGSYPPFL